MKTTKLILSITLVVLATTSFGQLVSIDGQSRLNALKERIFPKRSTEVAYSMADYQAENSRIENYSCANNRAVRNAYEAPVVCMSIFVPQVEVIFEENVWMENWMAAPFESCVADEELSIESWMAAPFEAGEVIEIEEWMTAPFEAGEVIEIEEWMTVYWI